MKTFKGLEEGMHIRSTGGTLLVIFLDFYGNGVEVMCFADKKWVYPSCVFSPEDWEIVKE